MFWYVHDMYEASCYFSKNKLVEICFTKTAYFSINVGGGGGGLNKYLHLKRGAY